MVERLEDGRFHPYVMDFGLARETAGTDQSRSGLIEGTPRFMAPEQARGDTRHLDRRTDVYALGVTLYEILCGRSPYESTGEVDYLIAVLTAEAKPLRAVDPTLPPDLEAIALKCLEKEQASRYDSAKALADDLQRYLDGEPVQARRIGLAQRLYRRAKKHKALVALGAALLVSLGGLLTYGVQTRLAARERERQAQRQAEALERLGQEISQMEWLLRSARQLPLHDLEREKGIIRARMGKLQGELGGYGKSGQGLVHYALGRGHLALHEYGAALAELRKAEAAGAESADLQWALGLVLGKHYEQAMYEARLSGGGEWAQKELKEIEPKYLKPALEALRRSGGRGSESPKYLEGLTQYYQRDFAAAVKAAEDAERESPWLYEARKLIGDIELERALDARDRGKEEAAKEAFGRAVRAYERASEVGRSDGEVYQGLAEAWVRQIEMAATKGQGTEAAYAAAMEASDKLLAAEPGSVAGRLKKAYAALMTMAVSSAGTTSAERVKQCLAEAKAVLEREADNPYARDVAADCNAFAADGAAGRGENPEPLLRTAISLLEPALRRYPHFLWGWNDLASFHISLGAYFQLHGDPLARELLEQALQYGGKASALDQSYLVPLQNALYTRAKIVPLTASVAELDTLVGKADETFAHCMKVNDKFEQCYVNGFEVYARAAERAAAAGQSPQRYLQRALELLEAVRKLGGSFLDVEQHDALARLIDAQERVRRQQDPGPALAALQAALGRCFALGATDATCRTVAAQAEWTRADWLAQTGKAPLPALQAALARAEEATRSPETYPDAWQVMAETHLRLARAPGTRPEQAAEQLRQGLLALRKVFAVNPSHASGRATEGELTLAQAERAAADERRALALQAARAFEQALRRDPLLTARFAPSLQRARALAGS